MAENSKIEWCDHTASPWHGCSKTDNPGCDNCYAAAMAVRNPETLGVWGDDGTRVKSKSFVKNLRTWQKKAAREGRSVTVFPSICDPFEDRPELVPWRQEMFAVADECPNVILLLLTKRPENVRRMWPACPWHINDEWGSNPIPHRPNVWLGCSVSDQPTADKNVPELLKLHDLCPVLFLSAEPLLGPVDLRYYASDECRNLDWCIIGGESGHGARPCNVAWIRSLVSQCQAAGVPAFVNEVPPEIEHGLNRHSQFPRLHDRKGGDPDEWPEDLRVRQFPTP
jgi:protein gp37